MPNKYRDECISFHVVVSKDHAKCAADAGDGKARRRTPDIFSKIRRVAGACLSSAYFDVQKARLGSVELEKAGLWINDFCTANASGRYHFLLDALKNGRVTHVEKCLRLAISGKIPWTDPVIESPEHLLNQAADRGYAEIIRLLTQLPAVDVNMPDERGMTPLHRAAQNGHRDAALALLDLGADAAARDKDGRTPTFCAAEHNHHHILADLGQRAAATLSIPNRDGDLPAHVAAVGASRRRVQGLQVIAQYAPETLNMHNRQGRTPAHGAGEHHDPDALRIIAQYAPKSLGCPDINGKVPAHGAATNGCEDSLTIIATLTPESLFITDQGGNAPAHYAAKSGHAISLKVIGQHVPDSLQVRNHDGQTPAHIAAIKGNFPFCEEALLEIAKFSPSSLKVIDHSDRSSIEYYREAKGRPRVMDALLTATSARSDVASERHARASWDRIDAEPLSRTPTPSPRKRAASPCGMGVVR